MGRNGRTDGTVALTEGIRASGGVLFGERKRLSAAPGVPPTSARPRKTLHNPSEPGGLSCKKFPAKDA